MMEYLTIIYEGATEVSPSEAVGALILGFFIALACSGLCIALQKRTTNPLPLVCGLIFLACAGSMAFGVGHSRYRFREGSGRLGWANPSDPARPVRARRPPSPPQPLGWQLLHEADADHNGQLTPEEAAQYIRNADMTGKGWVGVIDIDRAQIRNNGSTARVHPPGTIPGQANRDGL